MFHTYIAVMSEKPPLFALPKGLTTLRSKIVWTVIVLAIVFIFIANALFAMRVGLDFFRLP